MMSATFPRFPDLPAELRARIWKHALFNDYRELHGNDRIIEFHGYCNFDSILHLPGISVTVSRRYPTLFAVNREARYETTKLDGGGWARVKARHNGDTETSKARSAAPGPFEIYINFDRDTIFISERFIEFKEDLASHYLAMTPVEFRLRTLAMVMDGSSLQRIQNLQLGAAMPLTIEPPSGSDAWRGNGLQIYSGLETVTFVTDNQSFGHWTLCQAQMALQSIRSVEQRKRSIPMLRSLRVLRKVGRVCVFSITPPALEYITNRLGFDEWGIYCVELGRPDRDEADDEGAIGWDESSYA
ncbi:hypothetical protein BU26DRAFT_115936 [Trematosphaeria pertusa]|uniref:2EXR domain-containing protein n=1 Tax=Trematosphaeria pertusa TaxID=390896 RepID=A0A6A6I018_9PLEO|nr:uncharacterized protein BU26DRAFT_115936 [Trematosphaeria pertusa]KAF2243322.1 hypothetical protein BU26DRAFT_115936 [Trematosphaeria pertusa]